MARKFGKKVEIQLNPLDYNIGLLGESGIGKSTLMKEVCEKLVGEDGYLALDIGKEDGHGAISGIVSERIDDWDKFKDVTDDIIDNKNTDYKDLKVVIIDTYDELFNLAEAEAIRQYNKKNPDKPKAETINAAWGGFGAGLDKTIELVLDRLWELKKVGVSFIVIAHTKKKDIDDPVTGQQYSILTSNISQKYFNAIKTKLHFLGMAYIDRDIVQEKTGKKNIKTGKEIEKGKIIGESRVIRFRDDTYSVDSKSRFAEIVDCVEFNSDAFIKALKDAILAEQKKSGISIEEAQKKQEILESEKVKKAEDYIINKQQNNIDEVRNTELIQKIQTDFPKSTEEVKAKIKKIMLDNKIPNFKNIDIPTSILEEIVSLLG